MNLRKTARNVLLFVLASAMLCVVPVFAADSSVQADYNLYVSNSPAEQGDILTISNGETEYVYAVSSKAVRGLEVNDTRSYAGAYSAVAGIDGMLLTLSDPDCEGIVAEGNWSESVEGSNVTVTFNGEEQELSGELELECKLGKLTVNADGSIKFSANAGAGLVTISQNNGTTACSVSLERRSRALPKESTAEIVLYERNMDDWVGVPLPRGMEADPEHLSWNQYLQFSVANGNLFCRQIKEFPFDVKEPIGGMKHSFVLLQSGGLTASGDWYDRHFRGEKYLRFNGEGHAFDTPDTVSDGIFTLCSSGRWTYTADDSAAGAFQFTNEVRGVILKAAVGRGNVPEMKDGGEELTIENDGHTYSHTMQRLSTEAGNDPLEVKFNVIAYVLP